MCPSSPQLWVSNVPCPYSCLQFGLPPLKPSGSLPPFFFWVKLVSERTHLWLGSFQDNHCSKGKCCLVLLPSSVPSRAIRLMVRRVEGWESFQLPLQHQDVKKQAWQLTAMQFSPGEGEILETSALQVTTTWFPVSEKNLPVEFLRGDNVVSAVPPHFAQGKETDTH